MEQLSAQARQDTALIREQADRIDELQQQLQTDKVRYCLLYWATPLSLLALAFMADCY